MSYHINMYKKVKEAKIEIIGGRKLALEGVKEIVESITKKMNPETEVVWEAKINNKMGKSIKMTALLTF